MRRAAPGMKPIVRELQGVGADVGPDGCIKKWFLARQNVDTSQSAFRGLFNCFLTPPKTASRNSVWKEEGQRRFFV